jgi:hypothetical protein
MDGERFDALVRVLGAGAHRRRVLGGLLALVPLALTDMDVGVEGKSKKKKKKKKKKKNKSAASCPREQNCAGKQCGDDGCGGTCGSCSGNSTCTAQGQCRCQATCAGKLPCASDGCSGTCGECENGLCSGGQCLCPFPVVRSNPMCTPGFCPFCSPGVCCPQLQTCLNGECEDCPEAPDPCELDQEHFCGRTTATGDPFCYCVTSIDGAPACSSVFGDEFQSRDCTSDEDCATLVNVFGAETICVHAPCLPLVNPNVVKVCINKDCEDLLASQRMGAESNGTASSIRQLRFRSRD